MISSVFQTCDTVPFYVTPLRNNYTSVFHKKAFRSKANLPLSSRFREDVFLHGEVQVNRFEHVQGWGQGIPMWVRGSGEDVSKWTSLNRSRQWSHGDPTCEQTHTTENITFPQLRWRTVKNRVVLY